MRIGMRYQAALCRRRRALLTKLVHRLRGAATGAAQLAGGSGLLLKTGERAYVEGLVRGDEAGGTASQEDGERGRTGMGRNITEQ